MKPPCILTVTRSHLRKGKVVHYAGELHLAPLLERGAAPVIVPAMESALPLLRFYRGLMDGLLLVEGGDLGEDIVRHSAVERKWIHDVDPAKDRIELALIRHALRHGVPILGVCRGAQLLNVACGGTLFADVVHQRRPAVHHISDWDYDGYRHDMRILPGTPLRRWLGASEVRVNSYHHQGVRELARGFEPMAYAEDGLLEAFHDPRRDFAVGIQFHPERMMVDVPRCSAIFGALVAAARRHARRRGEAPPSGAGQGRGAASASRRASSEGASAVRRPRLTS